MDEKIFELSFGIIGYAGEAKGLAFEGIAEAKKGNIEGARQKLKESKEVIVQAHRYQTELIQNEASGNKNEVSVVLIHAQDHLMTTMNYQMLAEEFIDLYEKLESK